MLGIGRKRSPKRTSILFGSKPNNPVQHPTKPHFPSQTYSPHLPAERALGQGRRPGRLGSRRQSPRRNILHPPPRHERNRPSNRSQSKGQPRHRQRDRHTPPGRCNPRQRQSRPQQNRQEGNRSHPRTARSCEPSRDTTTPRPKGRSKHPARNQAQLEIPRLPKRRIQRHIQNPIQDPPNLPRILHHPTLCGDTTTSNHSLSKRRWSRTLLAQIFRERRIPRPVTPALQATVHHILRKGIHCSTSIQSGKIRTTNPSKRGPTDGHRTSILDRRGCHEGP